MSDLRAEGLPTLDRYRKTPRENKGKIWKRAQNVRADITKELEQILDTAEIESRSDLNPTEQDRYNVLSEKLQGVNALVDAHVELMDEEKRAAAAAEGGGRTMYLSPEGERMWGGVDQNAAGGFRFRDDAGVEHRALLPGESLSRTVTADDDEHHADVHVGKVLRAMLLNDTDPLNEVERRAMVGGSDTGGGYMLSPTVGAQIIDLARSASVVLRAGAQTLPMTSAELSLVKVDTDPTSHWRAEGVAVASTTVGLGKVTLRPKTLACIIPLSIELLEDASNAADAILTVVQRSMGQALDSALLQGAGGGSDAGPVGVRNYAGINTETTGGAPAAWTIPSNAIKEILVDNYDGELSGLTWIRHPSIGAVYDQLVDANGLSILPTPWVRQAKELFTTALPSTEGGGSNEHVEIIGDFSQCIIGTRTTGMVVEVLREGSVTDGSSDTWNATSQLLRILRIRLRSDMVLARPTWFCAMTGLTTS